MGSGQFVFFAQPRNQRGQAFSIRRREKGAILVAPPIGLDQVREILLEEGKKNCCGAGFEKKRIGENVIGARFRGGADKVIYLDPDIAVFHGLTGIEARLDTASIVLTPHQLGPNDTPLAIADNEMTSLKYGTYNLGFVAVRNDANGLGFAQWCHSREGSV